MNKTILFSAFMAASALTINAQPALQPDTRRHLWASVNNIKNASLGDYQQHTGKLLLSWRMLPTDTWETSFYIYSRSEALPNGTLTRRASNVTKSTCVQTSVPTTATVYYLVPGDYFQGMTAKASVTNNAEKTALRSAAIDSLLVDDRIVTDKLPYLSIPLLDTRDVCDIDTIVYQANNCSVGDLDGDGEMEIIVKRLQTTVNSSTGQVRDEQGIGGSYSNQNTIYAVIWDAYKLDGTLLWRIKGGPGIILGNSSSFAVADFDGDGCAEMRSERAHV